MTAFDSKVCVCWFMTLGKQSGYLEVHDTYTLVV